MVSGRKPLSPHGRLFGGDTLYEVLAALARERVPVSAVPLAEELRRTPKQTREELTKLLELGVIRQAGKSGKAVLLEGDETPLARAVLSLPDLLVNRFGNYRE
jgi:hypothetical protein